MMKAEVEINDRKLTGWRKWAVAWATLAIILLVLTSPVLLVALLLILK